jgi:hypothetical protein
MTWWQHALALWGIREYGCVRDIALQPEDLIMPRVR